jgi:hypothetical protein
MYQRFLKDLVSYLFFNNRMIEHISALKDLKKSTHIFAQN